MKPFEIFRTGTHTDMAGNVRAFTDADLDSIVEQYRERQNDAPIVCGHPKDSSPAFGWLEDVYREGQTLFAKAKNVVPAFADAVKDKLYKYVSISLRPDLSIRHVGFLGGTAPAVKGLAEVAFAEDKDVTTYDFMYAPAAYAFQGVGRLLGGIRDFFIEKFGKDQADKVLPPWEIDNIKATQADESNIVKSNFSEGAAMPELKELQDQVANLTAENADLKKKNCDFAESIKAKDAEIATLRSDAAKKEKDARAAGFGAFCEDLVAKGKLRPADKDAVLEQLEIMYAASQGQFAEGKVRPLDAYKRMLRNSKDVVCFAEIATAANAAPAAGGAGDAGSRLSALAREKMKTDKNLSFAEALNLVQRENREVAEEYARQARV